MQRMKASKAKTHRIEVVLSSSIKRRVERIAEAKKTRPQRVILDALTYYLPLADQDLENELAEWDRLSDEALIEFEKGLE